MILEANFPFAWKIVLVLWHLVGRCMNRQAVGLLRWWRRCYLAAILAEGPAAIVADPRGAAPCSCKLLAEMPALSNGAKSRHKSRGHADKDGKRSRQRRGKKK